MPTTILKKEFIPNRSGWDVSINVQSGQKQRFMVFHWPQIGEPNEVILAEKFAYFENQLANEPEPERSYTETELVDFLIDKKYLKKGDKLKDLPENPHPKEAARG